VSTQVFVSGDGDKAARLLEVYARQDRPEEVARHAHALERANDLFSSWALRVGGSTVAADGDAFAVVVPAEALVDLPQLMRQYEDLTQCTVSVGVGAKLSEASIAVKAAKGRGGDRAVLFSRDVADEVAGAERGEEPVAKAEPPEKGKMLRFPSPKNSPVRDLGPKDRIEEGAEPSPGEVPKTMRQFKPGDRVVSTGFFKKPQSGVVVANVGHHAGHHVYDVQWTPNEQYRHEKPHRIYEHYLAHDSVVKGEPLIKAPGDDLIIHPGYGNEFTMPKEEAGRPANPPPPKHPAFHAWFAGSKVVDEAGAPQRVFHGTNAPDDFSSFRVGDSGKNEASTIGLEPVRPLAPDRVLPEGRGGEGRPGQHGLLVRGEECPRQAGG
jgi:hypothetical protein